MDFWLVALLALVVLTALLVLFAKSEFFMKNVAPVLGGGESRRARRSRTRARGAPDVLQMYIQEPWFGEIGAGRKTVEGRIARPGRWEREVGKTIQLAAGGLSTAPPLKRKITAVRYYRTLDDYLDHEWEKAAPHARGKEEARELYLAIRMGRNREEQVFGPERVERMGGVAAIELGPAD